MHNSKLPNIRTVLLPTVTPNRPCNFSHCSIPATNVSYTLRSELPEYSSGGLIFNLIHVMIESSGSSSRLSSSVLHSMRIIRS